MQIFGASEYSMRLWLDPDKMLSRGMTAGDVIAAVQAQNVQVAAGTLGAEPAPPGTDFQLIVNTKGRLTDPKEFEKIIVKRGATASWCAWATWATRNSARRPTSTALT